MPLASLMFLFALACSLPAAADNKLEVAPKGHDSANLVLVATVDGLLHAIDKSSGVELWKTNPFPSAAIPQPPPSDDSLILAEPLGDGNLYVYSKTEASVTKLPFSIKDVASHPSFVTDQNMAYTSKKVSTLLALDPRTGAVVHSLSDGQVVSGGDIDVAVAVDPILISKTEYVLLITDLNTKKLKWNISYAEYEPATVPTDLFTPKSEDLSNLSYASPKRPIQIMSSVDGTVIIDDERSEFAWQLQFDSPALSAFTVQSKQSMSSIENRQQMLHQVEKVFPLPSSNYLIEASRGSASKPSDTSKSANNNNVFIGKTQTGFYLLSEANSKVGGISSIENSQQSQKRKLDEIESGNHGPKNPTDVIKFASGKQIKQAIEKTGLNDPSLNHGSQKSAQLETLNNAIQITGVHKLKNPSNPSSSTNSQRSLPATNSQILGLPAAPTSEEWHEFFHVSRGWRLIESILGITTSQNERVFVYLITALFVLLIAMSGYYIHVASMLDSSEKHPMDASTGGLLNINGTPIFNTADIKRYYDKLVHGFLESSAPLLPQSTKTVQNDPLLRHTVPDTDSSTSTALLDSNPFDVVNRILQEAKELPALPPPVFGDEFDISDAISSPSKHKKGATNVSRIHHAAVVNSGSKKKGKKNGVRINSSNQEKQSAVVSESQDVKEEAHDQNGDEHSADTALGNNLFLRLGSDSDTTVASNITTISRESIDESSLLKTMTVSDQVLGHGSHGTMVFRGTFEGRPVAIKRLLLDFYEVAEHEVKILRESDQHQNVVRYFYQETTDRFMYIALELCPASLSDLIESQATPRMTALKNSLNPQQVLHQITNGLRHIHSLKLVHRDIKPQNILIADATSKYNHPRVLISDFGLCKRLAEDQSSFHNTHTTGGTIGWRAPECMLAAAGVDSTESSSFTDVSDGDAGAWIQPMKSAATASSTFNLQQRIRITKSIDIFSAGCVFYYYLTSGAHPYGDKFTREINILKGNFRLDRLDTIKDGGAEAKDLIRRMILKDPKKRIDTDSILTHPFFWTASKRLAFLQDVSDRLESEPREPPSAILKQLERGADKIINGPSPAFPAVIVSGAPGQRDWSRRIDRRLLTDAKSFRSYDMKCIQDLLRMIRNKKHHYAELSAELKAVVGSVPEGFVAYFTSRFPGLLMHVYHVLAESKGIKSESLFVGYFKQEGHSF